MLDPAIKDIAYQYFLTEAPDLLQTIDHELIDLSEKNKTHKVRSLMRATHTLKGSAANAELETIKVVSHYLEDIFKALSNPKNIIDEEIQYLLLQGYECLKISLYGELNQTKTNNEEILDRAASIFAQIQNKIGSLEEEDYFPTDNELGFDIIESIFSVGVEERLTTLENALESNNISEINELLENHCHIFIDLAHSLNLPGFEEIAKTTLNAIKQNPPQIKLIAQTALNDFRRAQADIKAGDRQIGGQVSDILQQLSQPQTPISLAQTLEEFQYFLETKLTQVPPKQPSSNTAISLYLNITKCILGWFNQNETNPLSQLLFPAETDITTQSNYLSEWLSKFLDVIKPDTETPSAQLYQEWSILNSLLALAKYQSYTETHQHPLIKILTNKIQQIATNYQQHPKVTEQDKKWIDHPLAQEFINRVDQLITNQTNPPEQDPLISETSDELLEEVWGEEDQEFSKQFEPTIIQTPPSQPKSNPVIPPPPPPPTTTTEKSHEATSIPLQQPTIRVNLAGLEQINYITGELLINQNKQSLVNQQLLQALNQIIAPVKQLRQTIKQLHEWSDNKPNQPLTPESRTTTQTITFSQTIPTWILNLASEELAKIETASDPIMSLLTQSTQHLKRQQRMLSNMRDELVAARMSPLGNIFNRFPKMLETLAKAHGKQIELKISGQDILVDKAISEKLYDPLLHLLRNSFDHGIETPEKRHQHNKPPIGTIELTAYHQGGQTIIEIRDDGQGINFEKIRTKALELNLKPKEQLEKASPSQLVELLFEPGFSTTDQISDLSGRGVGLDVVKTQIQSLKGTVAVESQLNVGTTFSLQIPLTLTISKLMVCQADGITYALLMDSIEKIVLPISDQIKEFDQGQVLYWEDQGQERMIPIKQLSNIMEYNTTLAHQMIELEKSNTIPNTYNPILLIRNNQELIGLQVDKIIGEQELVIKPLARQLHTPNYIYGCSILGNSRLTLVIDSANLAKNPTTTPPNPLLTTPPPLPVLPPEPIPTTKPTSSHQTLLIVEDSIGIRQTLAMTFQKAGFNIITSENGEEALQLLLAHPEIELIVSDVEMPKLNGFELLNAVKKNTKLSNIPIIILTAQNSEKYKTLAQALGAKGYFTKPYNESELLNKISSLLTT